MDDAASIASVDVRQLAYELWLTDAGREVRKTGKLLAERGHVIPERTLYHWSEDWPARHARHLAAELPLTMASVAARSVATLGATVDRCEAAVRDPETPVDQVVSLGRYLLDVSAATLPALAALTHPEPLLEARLISDQPDPAERIAALRRQLTATTTGGRR